VRPGTGRPPTSLSQPTTSTSRVAVGWFALLYDLVRSERLSPPVASRAYAMAGVALYEAIVLGMPLHRSLVGQLNELMSLPQANRHRKHHWPTVANAALARILSHLFAGRPAALARIATLEAESASVLGEAVPRRVLRRSAARPHDRRAAPSAPAMPNYAVARRW
jgi:hypothetical protein